MKKNRILIAIILVITSAASVYPQSLKSIFNKNDLGLLKSKVETTSSIYSQNSTFEFSNKLDSNISLKISANSGLKLNIGMGVISSYENDQIYSSVIPVGCMFNLKFIDKHIFLSVGADFFTNYKISTSLFYINLIPSIGYNFFKNKVSVYLGAGIGLRPVLFEPYFTLYGRFEYNINEYFSGGLEVKHPFNYDASFKGNSVNLINLFGSYNLYF